MAYSISNTHPRLMITSGDVLSLQVQAASGDPRYLALKSLCDAGGQFPPYADDFALLYQVTGDSVYARAAIAMTSGSLNVSDISGDSFLPCKTTMPQVACTYDWCLPVIQSLGLQGTYIGGMTNQANAVWPETDPTRTGAWAVADPSNNYFYGFLNTWQYAITLFYDTAAASGWLANAVAKFTGLARPYLASHDFTSSASGGYWQEGTSYGAGSSALLHKNLYAHAIATGENLFTSGGFRWPQEAVLAQLYLTAPNRAEDYPGGAQAGTGNALRPAQRGLMQAAQRFIDATVASYAKHWLNTSTYSDPHGALREDFMYYRPEVPPVDYAALPLDYFAPGTGLATCRSDWTTGATQLWFICGPQDSAGNHQTNAANGFQIWRNYWLAASTQINHSTDGAAASDNNSVTIGANEQYYGSNTSSLNYHTATSGFAYYSGEASPAYQKPGYTTWLNGFRRDLLFLKPNLLIVSDRLDAPDSSLTKKFHVNGLQSTPPPINGNTYVISGFIPETKLFGTSLLPAAATLSTTNTYSGVYRVDVAAPTGSSVDYLLNTLETALAAQGAATTVSGLVTSSVGVQGIQTGRTIGVFDMRGGVASTFSYGASGGGLISHVIATGHPSTAYVWSLTPAAASSAPTGSVTTSSQGVLAFTTTTTGFASLQLATAGPQPPFYVFQNGSNVSTAAASTTVHLSGAAFGAATGTVTFGTSGATLSSWTTSDIAARVPVEPSYPHTDDIVVAWTTSATVTSGAHFTAASTQWMKATNPAVLTPAASQSFSFAGWVYLDSKTAERAFLSKFSTGGGQRGYVLTYDNVADRFRFYGSSDGNSASNVQDSHLGSPSTATWYFIACGFDSPNNNLWLSVNNAAKDTTGIGTTTVFASNADFYFSTYNAGTTSPHDGRVDNWGAWFGKVLSTAEISSLYNAGAGVQYSALSGTSLSGATEFWQFDDAGGAGTVWTGQVRSVPLTGGATTAAPTNSAGLVPFSSSTSSSLTYSAFQTTAPAAVGPAITAIQLNGQTVTTAPALARVHILGSGFGAASGTVLFGLKTAAIVTWSDTDISCLVAAQDSYPATVTVTVSDASAASDTRTGFVVTRPLPTSSTSANFPSFLFF